MTLQEARDLKLRIDHNLEALNKREVAKAAAIANALDVLIQRDANQALIDTWLKTIDNEIDVIIKTLEEIEAEFLE